MSIYFFFFNDPATTEIYPLSLHDALPISRGDPRAGRAPAAATAPPAARTPTTVPRGSQASSSAAARNSSISAGSASAAATWVGSPAGSKWLMRRTPDVPASAAFQNESRSNPIGVTTPSPVTTTRRRPGALGEQ